VKLGERTRWWFAHIGPFLLEASSFMPLFGGTAKYLYRCRCREFTGEFDDCFNDYLPILEFSLPILALLLLYPFARFSFSLYAPDPEVRSMKWRLATDTPLSQYFPTFHVTAGAGLAWTVWRAFTYPPTGEMWPYWMFWLTFAGWFAAGILAAWPRKVI
jgi:hypothetical protein